MRAILAEDNSHHMRKGNVWPSNHINQHLLCDFRIWGSAAIIYKIIDSFTYYICLCKESEAQCSQDAGQSFLTWTKIVKRCLSSAGLPREPGYSKSKSIPSNPYWRRYVITESMKVLRLAAVATIVVNLKKPDLFLSYWKYEDIHYVNHKIKQC